MFFADGKTPAAGATVYVYHTDTSGLYGPTGSPPRYRAWMTTDDDGRFDYRTIVPAPYPGRQTAAHVHTQLWGGGVPVQWNETLFFAGDSLLAAKQRLRSRALGRFSFVQRLVRDGADGWRCAHLLRAKVTCDELQPGLRHGVDDAPESAPSSVVVVPAPGDAM